MDDKTSPKSDRPGDAFPSVDRTNGDPTGQQPHPQDQKSQGTKLLELSWPQVVGGALAAMTAAVLGSRLGVAGTVAGAALASICAAVFGSVYTTSIRRTQKMAMTALSMAQNQRGRSRQPPTATTLVDAGERPTATASALPSATEDRSPATIRRNAAEPRRSRRVLITSMVGAVAVFIVAIGAIAAFEVASGRTLDGSKGTTTVGEVFRGSGGHKSGGTHSDKNGPTAKPSGDASGAPSAAPSSTPQAPGSPGGQASRGATPHAPQASGPAGPGSNPSAGHNSGGQDSGGSQTGGGSGSAGSGSSSSGSGSGSSGSSLTGGSAGSGSVSSGS